MPLSLLLGVTLALRRDGRLDRWCLSLLIYFKATPTFCWNRSGAAVLDAVVNLLPAISIITPDKPLLAQLEFLVLPVLALGLSSLYLHAWFAPR